MRLFPKLGFMHASLDTPSGYNIAGRGALRGSLSEAMGEESAERHWWNSSPSMLSRIDPTACA
jgi:hypothetical protein